MLETPNGQLTLPCCGLENNYMDDPVFARLSTEQPEIRTTENRVFLAATQAEPLL